jgi:hypothetical protein
MADFDTQHRQTQLDHLFTINYSALRDLATADRSIRTIFVLDNGTAYDRDEHGEVHERPRKTTVDIADEAIAGIARHLGEYDGPIDDSAAFLSWAEPILIETVEGLSKFYGLLQDHSKAIRWGIRSALPSNNLMDDRQAMAEESFWAICQYIFLNFDKAVPEGQDAATTGKRLYGIARTHTLGYFTLKLRRRYKAGCEHLNHGGRILDCEVVSEAELAELAHDQHSEQA